MFFGPFDILLQNLGYFEQISDGILHREACTFKLREGLNNTICCKIIDSLNVESPLKYSSVHFIADLRILMASYKKK